jgi:hypothetical protein
VSGVAELIRSISNEDAATRYREEMADNGVQTNDPIDSSLSNNDEAETIIISWDENDKENPYNWSSVCRRRTNTLPVY